MRKYLLHSTASWRAAAAAMVICSVTPAVAFAQSSDQAETRTSAQKESSARSAALGEILVTATRRVESIQSVPISVSAFSNEDMKMRNIETGRDLQMAIPNVMISAGGLGQEQSDIRIRGVPGVGVYLDGIWQGDLGVLEANLLEMDRVEVLRGPQGTLFGRNTNGGAIQYVTKEPSQEFGGTLELTGGTFKRRDIKATVNIPLSDTLFTKLTAAHLEHDGYLKGVSNWENNKRYGDANDTLIRGDVLWKPTEDLSVRLTAFNGRQHGTEGRQVRFSTQANAPWYNNPILKALNWLMAQPGYNFPSPSFDPIHYEPGYPGGEVGKWQTKEKEPEDSLLNNTTDYTATLKWNVSEAFNIESLTGYRKQFAHQLSLQDGADFVACCRDDRYFRDKQFSEEIHLTGNLFDGHVSYLGGFYYSDQRNYLRLYRWWYTNWFLPDATGNGNPDLNTALLAQLHAYGASIGDASLTTWTPQTFWFADNHRWTEEILKEKAVFGEVTWNITDKLSVTGGLRLSWRDDVTNTYTPGPNDAPALFIDPGVISPTEGGYPNIGSGNMWAGTLSPPAVPGVNESHLNAKFTPKVSASYHWTSDIMTYATYSQGYSGGGTEYVSALSQIIYLDPEVVSSYEVGIKSDLFHGTVRLNADGFFSRWTGLQVSRHPIDPVTGLELPAPYTTSDGKAKVHGAEVDAVWAVTDQFRVNFSGGWLKTQYTAIGDPDVSTLSFTAPFAYAPTWSFSVGAQYDMMLPRGDGITFRGDFGWKSSYQRDPSVARQTPKPEPAYGLLNMRVRYTSANGAWGIAVFGTNLTDKKYVDGGFVSAGLGLDLATVGPPREVGVTLNYNFK